MVFTVVLLIINETCKKNAYTAGLKKLQCTNSYKIEPSNSLWGEGKGITYRDLDGLLLMWWHAHGARMCRVLITHPWLELESRPTLQASWTHAALRLLDLSNTLRTGARRL